MRVVLAHFRLSKTWAQALGTWLIILSPAYVTFFMDHGKIPSLMLQSTNKYYLIDAMGIAWFCAILGFFVMFAVTKQLLFREGEALWIEGGSLMHVRRWILSCPSDQIVAISFGRKKLNALVEVDAIIAHLRNGKDKRFPTSPYRESPDVIIERLNAALGLPRK